MAKNDNIQNLLTEFLPDAQAIEIREPPHTGQITLYALLAMVVIFLIWATFSMIDKLVIARGRLVTPHPNLVVQPLEPGILKEIKVRVGQVVKQGAVLATLDQTFAAADLSQYGTRSETLSLQAQRLEWELQGKTGLETNGSGGQQQLQTALLAERQAAYSFKLLQFSETIQRLRASLETNQQDQLALENHLNSVREMEGMHQELEVKQFIPLSKLLEIREKRLEVEREHNHAVNREAEIWRDIAAAEAEKNGFAKTWRHEAMEDLSATLQERDEVNELLTKARLRSDLVTITAPQDAIILEIGKISIGSVVQQAEPLFVLVPLNITLEAEVEVAPSDIGQIRVGDSTRIKVDPYPFQKHGSIKGTVINVSADTFSRQTALGGYDYYYLARVSLDETQLKHVPTPTLLLPGMTVTGEIITGDRSITSYFLYPVIRIFDEALRER